MTKTCVKCGYDRKPRDKAPDYECPKCGAIYAKAEAALKNKREKRENNSQPGHKKTSAQKSFNDMPEQLGSWQGLFLVFILVVFAGIYVVYNLENRPEKILAKSPVVEKIIYNYKYKKTENLNGVKFYYFKKDNAPKLDPEDNFRNLNRTQLEQIFSLIPNIPSLPSAQPFRKGGKYIFTNDLKQGGKVSVHIRQCNKKTNQYYCIEKIIHTLGAKEMAMTRARKMPGTYIFVSKEQYGDKWPYLFEYGLLECKSYKDVVIHNDHEVYAVNGKAMGAKFPTGTKMYKDAWDVRKTIYVNPVGKMSSPPGFIKKGLDLCK